MAKRIEISEEHAQKVLEVVDKGLVGGLGDPKPGKMCVEAAVAFAFGEDHNDQPKCVDKLLGSFKIGLNDLIWPSNKSRATGLRRLAVAQLGTRGKFKKAKFFDQLFELLMKDLMKCLCSLDKAVVWPYNSWDHPSAQQFFKGRDFDTLQSCLNVLAQHMRQPEKTDHIVRTLKEIEHLAKTKVGFRDYIFVEDMLDNLIDLRFRANGTTLGGASKPKFRKVMSALCEDIVQILIAMETPGSKFLYLTEK